MNNILKTTLGAAVLSPVDFVSTARVTENSKERQQARDVRQNPRKKVRDTQRDCISNDSKSNHDCRQKSRRIKYELDSLQ
ncbi:TPA: hypothetical protein ACS7Z1_002676 [Providencia alcalifaciens]